MSFVSSYLTVLEPEVLNSLLNIYCLSWILTSQLSAALDS